MLEVRAMEVILRKDVQNVGRIGELVKVKNGFARNFLLPRSLAVVASSGNKAALEHHKRIIEKEKAAVKLESEALVKDIEKLKFSLKKRFNESNKMFGSVTTSELIEELKAKGFSVDRRDLNIPEITEAGNYEVDVRLPGDVYSKFSLKIEAIVEASDAKPKKAAKKKETAKKEAKAEDTEVVAETKNASDADEVVEAKED